jgi:hypothetical protein
MNPSQPSPTKVSGGVSSTPLLFFQPFNIIVWMSFFSPIVLSIVMLSLSFVFQNFKGFIFLGYLLGVCLIRNYIYSYKLNGIPELPSVTPICSSIQYSKYGNPSFSAFVFAFTTMYISFPMFSNGEVNFWIFGGLLAYFFLDIFIKMYKKCIDKTKTGDLFLNVLLGLASAALIVTLMYAGGSSKFLFFNETSSTKEVCSVAKNQNFKCSLYRNGELISAMNTTD